MPPSVISTGERCIQPSSFHLKPVTEEDLYLIAFPSDEKFDVVDGLIVSERIEGSKKDQAISQLHPELLLLDEEFRAAQGKVQSIAAESEN